MKKIFYAGLAGWLVCTAVQAPASTGAEERFELLQIGTQMYTNVTVTTKSKTYVFVHHLGGLSSIKLTDLPIDVLVQLGYPDPSAPKVQTNGAAVWAKQTLKKLPVQQIKAVEQKVKDQLVSTDIAQRLPVALPPITTNLIVAVCATLLALYVFHSFCFKLICQKAGREPGILIWVPVLQLLPLLHAARMSRWWFLAYFVPVLNIVAQVIWSFKIADARNKSAVVGVFLLLPVLSLFAFLLLAFADEVPRANKSVVTRPIEIMTLEAV
jgi:Family of unknown function (DUF5684)